MLSNVASAKENAASQTCRVSPTLSARRQRAGQAERKTSWGSRRARIHVRNVHGVVVRADRELGVVQCPKTRPKSIEDHLSLEIEGFHRHRPVQICVRPVRLGARQAVAASSVVASSTLEASPVPTALMAETR